MPFFVLLWGAGLTVMIMPSLSSQSQVFENPWDASDDIVMFPYLFLEFHRVLRDSNRFLSRSEQSKTTCWIVSTAAKHILYRRSGVGNPILCRWQRKIQWPVWNTVNVRRSVMLSLRSSYAWSLNRTLECPLRLHITHSSLPKRLVFLQNPLETHLRAKLYDTTRACSGPTKDHSVPFFVTPSL